MVEFLIRSLTLAVLVMLIFDPNNDGGFLNRKAVESQSPGLARESAATLGSVVHERRNPDGVVSSLLTPTQRSRYAATLG
jgi:hypothetical protein